MADETKSYEELLKAFIDSIISPRRVKTDSGEVEQQSLYEQMRAFELAKKELAGQKKGPLLGKLGVYQINNLDE